MFVTRIFRQLQVVRAWCSTQYRNRKLLLWKGIARHNASPEILRHRSR